MPQASEEQRRKWGDGGGAGDRKAIGFLESAGYVLQRNWCWKKPTSGHTVTQDEFEAMCFLVDEWDFGGIAP